MHALSCFHHVVVEQSARALHPLHPANTKYTFPLLHAASSQFLIVVFDALELTGRRPDQIPSFPCRSRGRSAKQAAAGRSLLLQRAVVSFRLTTLPLMYTLLSLALEKECIIILES
jgi:hypothetical protein